MMKITYTIMLLAGLISIASSLSPVESLKSLHQAGHFAEERVNRTILDQITNNDNTKAKLNQIFSPLNELASNRDNVPQSVIDSINWDDRAFLQEARALSNALNISKECTLAVVENSGTLYSISQIISSTVIAADWDSFYWNELYDICVACSGGNTYQFKWLQTQVFTLGDLENEYCNWDFQNFANIAYDLFWSPVSEFSEDLIAFINSITEIGKDCPSIYQYNENRASEFI